MIIASARRAGRATETATALAELPPRPLSLEWGPPEQERERERGKERGLERERE